MKPKIAILLMLTAALAPSPPAFGFAADYGPGESISHPDTWPPRLVELAKLPSRVAGYFINQDEYFAFQGDTAGFRACFDICAALGEFAPTTLHVHKGKGSFQPLDKEKKPSPCDWQLDVINQHWRAGEPNPKGPMYSLELHVWLDGSVDLATVKVPPNVKTIQEANPPAASSSAKGKPEESPIKSLQLPADDSPETIAVAATLGTETAATDIKVGVFRILEYGQPRQITEDTKDPQTGFRIQSVAGCKINQTLRAEAEAYNQVMRDWHAKNPTPLKK